MNIVEYASDEDIAADFAGATVASAPSGPHPSHITYKNRLRLGLCHRSHRRVHGPPPDALAVLKEAT